MRLIRKSIYNINAVIRSDIRRLGRSVVSFVIVLGLILLPCLYSWFNTISNWDPYSATSTGNMKVAVYNEDVGITLMGVNVNVGSSVIDGLKANDAIGWQFVGSSDEALEGVYSGDYYAALIIPEDFTTKLMGFISGKYDKPHIIYYENQKVNIVSPRITSKADTTVKNTVNSTFISTLAQALTNIGNVANSTGLTLDGTLDDMDAKLTNMSNGINSGITVLDSLLTVTDSAQNMLETSSQALYSLDYALSESQNALEHTQSTLSGATDSIMYIDSMLKSSAAGLVEGINTINSTVGNTFYDLNSIAEALGIANAGQVVDTLHNLAPDLTISKEQYDALNTLYQNTRSTLNTDIGNLNNTIQGSTIGSDLVSSLTDLQNSIADIQAINEQGAATSASAQDTLAAYSKAVDTLSASMAETRQSLSDLNDMVLGIQDSIRDFRNSDLYQQLNNALKLDSASLVDYLSSPVDMQTINLFAAKDYGSPASPFYTILTLWVGGLFNIVIIRTRIKPSHDLPKLTAWESFWGRYFTVFAIGFCTAIITGLGNLYYIGVQCYYPLLYLLALVVADFTITLINYVLLYAFDVAGLALSVIIMCLQVGGSGGTYPIEVLPAFFSKIYDFMPFKYGMFALKETICGMYDHTYIHCLLILLLMAVIMIPIAFLGKWATAPLIRSVKKGMERTKIMGA